MRGGEIRGWSAGVPFCHAAGDPAREYRRGPGLRTGPKRCGRSAAAIMVTATGAMDLQAARLSARRAVALVRFADAAGVRRRSSSRERQRNKISDKRDEQQKSGCQALHAFRGM